MNHPDFWLSATLASNFLLVLLSAASCLFLIRRLDQIVRARATAEQRLIQLAFDLRRLEQRIAHLDLRPTAAAAEAPSPPALKHTEAAPSLIAVPDLSYQGDAEGDDADNFAQKHGDVWALVEAGRDPTEIAEATGRPIGQVELIVGLYRQYLATRNVGDHARAT
ncbi:MAG: hypothetical protein P4L85_15885 [Paludisphaera borealis]|uniref:hypothetical protein n=1 Tax=Paludisphaera borealis TaxID=1387353 RepID=UPI002845C1EB|nr:hypothetical protein [Paludisphaera borealis]MDR3620832.1 hypothetical protein [Paludisphaera borealis]